MRDACSAKASPMPGEAVAVWRCSLPSGSSWPPLQEPWKARTPAAGKKGPGFRGNKHLSNSLLFLRVPLFPENLPPNEFPRKQKIKPRTNFKKFSLKHPQKNSLREMLQRINDLELLLLFKHKLRFSLCFLSALKRTRLRVQLVKKVANVSLQSNYAHQG